MTKPHTTLSEAVRALELPTPTILDTAALTSWEAEVFARGALAMRKAAAALVEQHEAQEPVLWVESEPSARLLPLSEVINGMCYTVLYHHKKPNTDNPVWPLYAQPTLAATQAGDAKDAARYRWFKDNYLKYGNSDPDIRRPIILFEGRWYGGHFDNMNDLDVAIDAAMSPTTTRSE